MALREGLFLVRRLDDLFIGDVDLALAMAAAMGEQPGLVRPQFDRRTDVAMAIDDHESLPRDYMKMFRPPACPRRRNRWRCRCPLRTGSKARSRQSRRKARSRTAAQRRR